MDQMQRRLEGVALAPPIPCPEAGCPETLYRDSETPVLRCPTHGPMLHAEGDKMSTET